MLLTDMLLILKPKKKVKMNMVQSKLSAQMPQLDWFSDLGCKAKRVSTVKHWYLLHTQFSMIGSYEWL